MSNQNQHLNVGLFGFGVVGSGLYQVLQKTPSLNASIKKIAIKHPEKERNAPAGLFTTDAGELLNDTDINVIIELIDDADAALYIARTALKKGKLLISANKKMIAENLEELITLQEQYQTAFLYEAACCASIPVIRNLEEYYDNDLLVSLSGIVNGSTNYILSKINAEGLSFETALKTAQEKGFAESDPSLDISGRDAVNKLSILLNHAFGIISHPDHIVYQGIEQLSTTDTQFAREKGLNIKLIAHAQKINNNEVACFVLPQFISSENNLYLVKDEYNGIIIESGLADRQFFSGKGAGSFPTASAVLSDLSALRYLYKYEYKKLRQQENCRLSNDYYLKVYFRSSGDVSAAAGEFVHVESWHSTINESIIIGIIHSSSLQKSWWKEKTASLICFPEAVLSTYEKTEKEAVRLPIAFAAEEFS